MKENWTLFVESAKAKGENHEKYAQFWDSVHNSVSLVLIILSAITTVLASLHVPKLVVVGISGATTLLSAVAGFLQPAARKHRQAESAKEFRSMMLRMIRCETEKEYEELWREFTKEVTSEPFLPNEYKVGVRRRYSMTPEMMIIVDQKKDEVAEALADDGGVKSMSKKDNSADVPIVSDDDDDDQEERQNNEQVTLRKHED